MINVAIKGYGNIGKAAEMAIISSSDMKLIGVIRSEESLIKPFKNFNGAEMVSDISALSKKPDVILICTPTRYVKEHAIKYLNMGINTVDSFDIHENILSMKKDLTKIAEKNNKVSIISAGWDPGTDSIIRCLLSFMAPKGITYTNFGPGMSMGHSTAVKDIHGVKDALSLTMPKGHGIHTRMVYIELENGADFNKIEKQIKQDQYFINDETHVFKVEDISDIKDMGHGVMMTRKGVSGSVDNQMFHFDMRINNPSLTAQIMVASARACLKQEAGAYTMIEVPPIHFLSEDTDLAIKKFV